MLINHLFETVLKDKADLDAKRKALQDMDREPGHDREAVRQAKLDLEKQARLKGIAEDADDATEFYVYIGSEDAGQWIGSIVKDGGKWREMGGEGTKPHNWGTAYMSYLSPDEVMQWIRQDYRRGYTVEGPFYSDAEAYDYAEQMGFDDEDVMEQGVAEGLNEFSFNGDDDDTPKDDPYKYPKPEHYRRSIDFFGKFEANHFDKEDMDDATGVFKGYWYYGNKLKQIAYFKFDNPRRTGSNDPGMGWYYEPQDEDVAEGYSLGKVLSLPELLDQIKHILDAKHPDIGWRMTMPAENTFLFSAQNDYDVWSMLVVEPGGDDWVAVGHGMVEPDGEAIIFDRQQLPITLASASEIADEAIQTFHDIDLSDYADDEDYNQGVAEATAPSAATTSQAFNTLAAQSPQQSADRQARLDAWKASQGIAAPARTPTTARVAAAPYGYNGQTGKPNPAPTQPAAPGADQAAIDRQAARLGFPAGMTGAQLQAAIQSKNFGPGGKYNPTQSAAQPARPAATAAQPARPAAQPAPAKGAVGQAAIAADAAGQNADAAALAAMQKKNPKLAAMMAQAGMNADGTDIAEGEVYDLEKEYGYEKPATQPKRASVPPTRPSLHPEDTDFMDPIERRLRADQARVKAAWAAHNAKKDVAEGEADRKRNALWAQITSYEHRARDTKNDIKKQHLLKMADELRAKLPATDEEKLDEAFRELAEAMDANFNEFATTDGNQLDEAEQQKGADYRDPAEADYGDDYQAMVKRMKQLAGAGPLKTVHDPARRVYRNVPTAVQPGKK